MFPSLYLAPAYNSLTGSRVLRRSCDLFEESSDTKYGGDLSIMIREGHLQKAAAEQQLKQFSSHLPKKEVWEQWLIFPFRILWVCLHDSPWFFAVKDAGGRILVDLTGKRWHALAGLWTPWANTQTLWRWDYCHCTRRVRQGFIEVNEWERYMVMSIHYS